MCKPEAVYDKNNIIGFDWELAVSVFRDPIILTDGKSPQNDPKTGQESNPISKEISPSHQICPIASGTLF